MKKNRKFNNNDAVLQAWSDEFQNLFGVRPKAMYLRRLNLTVSPATLERERVVETLRCAKERMISMAVSTMNRSFSSEIRSIVRQATRIATETRPSRPGGWQRGLDLAGAKA